MNKAFTRESDADSDDDDEGDRQSHQDEARPATPCISVRRRSLSSEKYLPRMIGDHSARRMRDQPGARRFDGLGRRPRLADDARGTGLGVCENADF
jgi:hypothetical protein